MLVNRVVSYLKDNLKCEEVPSKVERAYRKFKSPETKEMLFVTDNMIFIGSSFKECRPARSILERASQHTN